MEFDRNCLQLSYALFFRLIHISLTFSERDVGTALSYSDKNHFEASISRKTYFKSSIWKYMATAPFSKTPRSCAVLFSWRHDGQDHRDKQTPKFTTVKFRQRFGFFCFVFCFHWNRWTTQLVRLLLSEVLALVRLPKSVSVTLTG